MSLDIESKYDILIGDYKLEASELLNTDVKYKLCIRFDGGLELVECLSEYWITCPRFNWNLKEPFNIRDYSGFNTVKYEDSSEDDEFGCLRYNPYKDYHFQRVLEELSFFVGNLKTLRNTKKEYFQHQFIECDYIEEIDKLPVKSKIILELLTDKRSNDRIGYCIRNRNKKNIKLLGIQSFNPIDVHCHCDEGYYHQAALFNKQSKTRLILMGQQNHTAGALAIPEMYFIENFSRTDEVDLHDKDYVKEFIKHNLIYCEEARSFYIPEDKTYACKECMAIAQDLIDHELK